MKVALGAHAPRATPSLLVGPTVGIGGAVPETRHLRTRQQVIGVPDPLVLDAVRHFYGTGKNYLSPASGPSRCTRSVKIPLTPHENSSSARS